MCMYSREHETRRARQDETLVVRNIGNSKVGAPVTEEAGIACACLKTGDVVQFVNVSRQFQDEYAVGSSPVANFIEGNGHKEVDRFFGFTSLSSSHSSPPTQAGR